MSFGTYRQYDSRWGRKNYNGSSSYATAGCGATSCANILHAINPSITPLTTGKFMQSHGYAIRNNGTAWAGIPACLKAFGAQDVRQVDSMADVFKYCAKGYVGVFLFRGGSKGGITWTTSGHYVAVTGYKYQNKKHYFRTFDSGGRKHDGWYCYETQMRGLIPRIWLCKIPTPNSAKPLPKPKPTYTGKLPAVRLKKGSRGEHVKLWQKFLNWYHPSLKLHVDGKFGNNTAKATKVFQKAEKLTADGVVGAKTLARAKTYLKPAPKKPAVKKPVAKTTNQQKLLAKMKELAWAYGTAKDKYSYKKGSPKAVCKKALKRYGWADNKAEMSDCGNNVSATVREAGVSKTFKALHGTKTPFPKSEKGFNIVLKGKKIPSGFLKPADIVRYKKQNGNQHALFYFGDGKVCEASHHNRYFAIVKDEKKYNNSKIAKISTVQVLRAK
jgi:peptidoglycan hydrolase-like protein with peptidoglycan-binding domain